MNTFTREELGLVYVAAEGKAREYLDLANAAYAEGRRKDYEYWLSERKPFSDLADKARRLRR